MDDQDIRPPDFPRPSSTIARKRLKNHFGLKNFTANGTNKKILKMKNSSTSEPSQQSNFKLDAPSDKSDRTGKFVPGGMFESSLANESLWSEPNIGSVILKSPPLKPDYRASRNLAYSGEFSRDDSLIQAMFLPASPTRNDAFPSSNAAQSQQTNTIIPLSASDPANLDIFLIADLVGLQDAANLIINGSQEFCYLEPEIENPYRFIVLHIPSDKNMVNFTTISKYGLSRSYHGYVEHVTLSQFHREYTLFHKLKKIQLFRHFNLCKTLFLWRRLVRQKKFSDSSKFLVNHLFCLDSQLRDLQFFVVERCLALERIKALQISDNKLYDMLTFTTTQRQFQQLAISTRSEILSSLTTHLSEEGTRQTFDSLREMPSLIPASASASLFSNVKRPEYSQSSTSFLFLPFPGTTGNPLAASQSLHTTTGNIRPPIANKSIDFPRSQRAAALAGGGDGSGMITALSYTERAAIRLSARRFSEFLRMVDLMLSSALYFGIETNLRLFHQKLSQVSHSVSTGVGDKSPHGLKNQPRSIFCLKLLLVPGSAMIHQRSDSLLLSSDPSLASLSVNDITPSNQIEGTDTDDLGSSNSYTASQSTHFILSSQYSKQEIINTIQLIIKDSMTIGSNTESLLKKFEFAQILLPIVNEIDVPVIEDRIFGDSENSLHRMLNQTINIIASDVDKCFSKISHYTYICDQYSRNEVFRKSLTIERLEALETSEVSKVLHRLQDEKLLCEAAAKYEDNGVMRLDLTDVFKMISEQHTQCQMLLHTLIPHSFRSKCSQLYHEMFILISELSTQHKSVGAFVSAVQRFHKANAEFAELEVSYYSVNALKGLMEEFQVAVPKDIAVESENLQSAFNRYLTVVTAFEDSLEENVERFKKELKKRSHDLQEPISSVNNRLTQELLMDPQSECNLVLREIRSIEVILDDIMNRALEIDEYQEVMKISVFDMDKVKELAEELSSNNILWEVVQIIKDLRKKVYSSHFLEVDCHHIDTTIKSAEYVSRRVKRENVRVQHWLKTSMNSLKAIDPLLKALQSKTLRDRHIARIHATVGLEIFSEEVLTVGELVELDIVECTEAFHFILVQAECENNLEVTLRDLQAHCRDLYFHLTEDENERSLLTYTNLEETNRYVQDIIITCNSALESIYVDPFRKEYAQLLQKLNIWLKLLNQLSIIQIRYFELCPLFHTSRVPRFLLQAVPLFGSVDVIWRAVTKVSKADSKVNFLFERPQLTEKLNEAALTLDQVCQVVDGYIQEQREKFPKLHILSRKALFFSLTTIDPFKAFECCRHLFPGLSTILFDGIRVPNVTGITSGTESLTFRSTVFYTGTIIDWFRSMETAVSDRLTGDIRMFVEGKRIVSEDLKQPKCCNQSRLVLLQLRFWNDFLKWTSMDDNHASRQLSDDIQDEIVITTKLFPKVKSSYQIQSISNVLIQLLHHRDIFQSAANSNRTVNPYSLEFLVECSLKKRWNSNQSKIFIQCNRVETFYGYRYLGFEARVIVTPLSERCLVMLSMAVLSGQTALIMGSNGFGRRGFLSEFATEFGVEGFFCDCERTTSIEVIEGHIFAAVGNGFFLSFLHVNGLENAVFSSLMNYILVMTNAINAAAPRIFIGDRRVNNPLIAPKIAISMNIKHESDLGFLPATIRKRFRVIRHNLPSRLAILSVLLESYDFQLSKRLAARVDAFCENLIQSCQVDEAVMFSAMILSVRERADDKLIPGYQEPLNQPLNIMKTILKKLPVEVTDKIDPVELVSMCNVFGEATLNAKSDELMQKDATENTLKHAISKGLHRSDLLVVVGAPGSGKTTLIKAAVAKLAGDRVQSAAVELMKKPEDRKIIKTLRLYSYPWSLPMMADMGPGSDFSAPSVVQKNDAAMYYLMREWGKDSSSQYVVILDAFSSEHFAVMSGWCRDYSRMAQLKFVWECCEVADISPTVACDYPMVHLRGDLYTESDIVEHTVQRLSNRFGKRVFHKVLLSCIELYLRPCLQKVVAVLTDLVSSHITLIQNTLMLFENFYSQSGIKSPEDGHENGGGGGGDNEALMELEKDNDNAASSNNQIGEVKDEVWDENSFRRIFIFACTWTLGVCSNSSRANYSLWYKQFHESTQLTHPELLPPAASPFDYYLIRQHQDDVNLAWRGWNVAETVAAAPPAAAVTTAAATATSSSLPMYTDLVTHAQCSNFNSHLMMLPTPTGMASLCIQNRLVKTGGHIMFLGDRCTGKSSLLRFLATQDVHYDHWLCYMTDCSPSALIKDVKRARANAKTLMVENRYQDRGCIFVDDVNLDYPSPESSTAARFGTCTETLRFMCENSAYYSHVDRRWNTLSKLYTVIGARVGKGADSLRLLRHYHLIYTDHDVLDIIKTKLCRLCPGMKDTMAVDVTELTARLIEKLNVALLDTDLGVLASAIRPIAESVNHILEALAVLVNKRSTVLAVETVSSWQLALSIYTAEYLSGVNIINNCIDSIIAGNLFSFSGFNEMVISSRKKASGNSLAKKQKLDQLMNPGQLNRATGNPEDDDEEEGRRSEEFFGYVEPLKLASYYVKRFGNPSLKGHIDHMSLPFWTDVQRLAVTNLVPGIHRMVLLGNNYSMVTELLSMACRLTDVTYKVHLLHEDPGKFSFSRLLVEKYLSEVSVEDLIRPCHSYLGRILVRGDGSRGSTRSSGDGKSASRTFLDSSSDASRIGGTVTGDGQKRGGINSAPELTTLWHLHFESGKFSRLLWAKLSESLEPKGGVSGTMLDSIITLTKGDPRSDSLLRQSISDFLTRQKIVITFGAMASPLYAIKQMSKIPSLLSSMRIVHVYPNYPLGGSTINTPNELLSVVESCLETCVREMDLLNAGIDDQSMSKIKSREYTHSSLEMFVSFHQFVKKIGQEWQPILEREMEILYPRREVTPPPLSNVQSSSNNSKEDSPSAPLKRRLSLRVNLYLEAAGLNAVDTTVTDLLYLVLQARYINIAPAKVHKKLMSIMREHLLLKGLHSRERYDSMALITAFLVFRDCPPSITKIVSKLKHVPRLSVMRSLLGGVLATLIFGESVVALDLSLVTLPLLVDTFGLTMKVVNMDDRLCQLGVTSESQLIHPGTALVVFPADHDIISDLFLFNYIRRGAIDRVDSSICQAWCVLEEEILLLRSAEIDGSHSNTSMDTLEKCWSEMITGISIAADNLISLVSCVPLVPERLALMITEEVNESLKQSVSAKLKEVDSDGSAVIQEYLLRATVNCLSILVEKLAASEFIAMTFALLIRKTARISGDLLTDFVKLIRRLANVSDPLGIKKRLLPLSDVTESNGYATYSTSYLLSDYTRDILSRSASLAFSLFSTDDETDNANSLLFASFDTFDSGGSSTIGRRSAPSSYPSDDVSDVMSWAALSRSKTFDFPAVFASHSTSTWFEKIVFVLLCKPTGTLEYLNHALDTMKIKVSSKYDLTLPSEAAPTHAVTIASNPSSPVAGRNGSLRDSGIGPSLRVSFNTATIDRRASAHNQLGCPEKSSSPSQPSVLQTSPDKKRSSLSAGGTWSVGNSPEKQGATNSTINVILLRNTSSPCDSTPFAVFNTFPSTTVRFSDYDHVQPEVVLWPFVAFPVEANSEERESNKLHSQQNQISNRHRDMSPDRKDITPRTSKAAIKSKVKATVALSRATSFSKRLSIGQGGGAASTASGQNSSGPSPVPQSFAQSAMQSSAVTPLTRSARQSVSSRYSVDPSSSGSMDGAAGDNSLQLDLSDIVTAAAVAASSAMAEASNINDKPLHIITRGTFSESELSSFIATLSATGRPCVVETDQAVFPIGLQLSFSKRVVPKVARTVSTVAGLPLTNFASPSRGYVIQGMNKFTRGDFGSTVLESLLLLVNLPMRSSGTLGSQSDMIMIRSRWLLCLAHSAIVTRFTNNSLIGDDTLLRACTLSDEYFMLQAALAMGMGMASSFANQSKGSHGSHNISSSNENRLAHFLSEYLYGLLVSSSLERDIIRKILSTYFINGALQMTVDSILQLEVEGMDLPIPNIPIDEKTVSLFHNELQYILEYRPNGLKFLQCSAGEFGEISRKMFQDSLEVYIRSLSSNIEGNKSNSGLWSSKLATVKNTLTRICDNLPARIDPETGIYRDQLELRTSRYNKSILQTQGKTSAIRKMIRRKGVSTSGDNKTIGRDVDSIWSFLLQESHRYNKSITSLKKDFECILYKVSCMRNENYLRLLVQVLEGDSIPMDWMTSLSQAEQQDMSELGEISGSGDASFCSFSSERLLYRNVSLEVWILNQLRERRHTLSDWLSGSISSVPKISSFQSAIGLFHALKEYHADRTGINIDRLFTNIEVCGVSPWDQEEVMQTSLHATADSDFHGTLILGGIYLSNAFWNKKTFQIEPLDESISCKITQELYLKFVLAEEELKTDSDLSCPLFVYADLPLSLSASQSRPVIPHEALFYVRLPCSTDALDVLQDSGVGLYGFPSWCLPFIDN